MEHALSRVAPTAACRGVAESPWQPAKVGLRSGATRNAAVLLLNGSSTSPVSVSRGKTPSHHDTATGEETEMWKRIVRRALVTTLLATTAALATATMIAPAAAAATPPGATAIEEASVLVEPSIVSASMTWTGWVVVPSTGYLFNDSYPLEVEFGCTGFVVDTDGYIATAAHCVTMTDDVRRALVTAAVKDEIARGGFTGYTVEQLVTYGMANWAVEGELAGSAPTVEIAVSGITDATGAHTGSASKAKVIAVDPWGEGDVALLQIDRSGLFALPVGEAATVDIGTPVVSVGFPGLTSGLTTDATFKDGAVNAATTHGGKPQMEISAAIVSGMSGGPTVDGNGVVVGVNSFGANATTEAFNYISSAANLNRLMDDAGVSNDLSQTSTAYRGGLEAYFAGDYNTAVERFDAVTTAAPANQTAVDYRRRALAQIELQGSPIPTWALVAGGGGLVLLGLGAAVMVVRRRSSHEPGAATVEVPTQASGNPFEQRRSSSNHTSNSAGTFADTGVTRNGARGGVLLDLVLRGRVCSGCSRPVEGEAAFCSGCGSPIA